MIIIAFVATIQLNTNTNEIKSSLVNAFIRKCHAETTEYICIVIHQSNGNCSIYVAVEVRMRTLDRFFEIGFLTYSDKTSHRLSLYHVLERKTLLRQNYRA